MASFTSNQTSSPYLYDDNEEFWSNVDYTVGSYENLLLNQVTVPQENPLHQMLAFAHYFLYYDGDHFLGYVSQGLLILALWTTAYFLLNPAHFPGNPDGKLWPLYIPEHYGVRNSQHLFDPYSFVHFGHGLLSYYAFGTLDGDEPPISYVKTRYNLKESFSKIYRTGSKGIGMLVTLFFATLFEMMENSQLTIQLFRDNSGTSESYRGDSSINVIGDLISCTFGYNVAKYFTLSGLPKIPLVIYFLTEFILSQTIRDNLMLIIIQLVYPFDWIREWQAENIPLALRGKIPNDIYRWVWAKADEEPEINEEEFWRTKYSEPLKSVKYKEKNEELSMISKPNEYWRKEQGYWRNKFSIFESLFE